MADTHTRTAGTATGSTAGHGTTGGSMTGQTGAAGMTGQAGAHQHTEGTVARTIEQQTAKLPSDLFLWAAGASIVGSLVLQLSGKREMSNFVGQWAPTFLILGLYNKIVKVAGSDRAGGGYGGAGGGW